MRNITWPVALLLLLSLEATAQRHNTMPALPAIKFPPGFNTARLQQKLAIMNHARPGAMLQAEKTTAGNMRLLAETKYDYTSTPATADSLVFLYSSGRSSEFDYEWLDYDYDAASADFYPIQFGNHGYVNYDSVHSYYPGTSNHGTPATRSYNAAGKVIRSTVWTDTMLFSYDASGRLKVSEEITSTNLPYRDFYFYDAAGHLIKDSTESGDGFGTWIPDGTYYYTVNAAGYPTKSQLIDFSGSSGVAIFESNNTYNGLNQVTATLLKIFNGTSLRNYYKDTIGYAGAMQQYSDKYNWDTVANAWALSGQERRRMNASALPDSAWSRFKDIYDPGPWDTTIEKLAYTAQDNPVNYRIFYGSSSPASYEYRWYYEPITNVSVNRVPAGAELLVYPNPAGEMLYLKGATEGNYSILNMAGQLLQSGKLPASSTIPVSMLSPGIYSISLVDDAGIAHTARFIKQ